MIQSKFQSALDAYQAVPKHMKSQSSFLKNSLYYLLSVLYQLRRHETAFDADKMRRYKVLKYCKRFGTDDV